MVLFSTEESLLLATETSPCLPLTSVETGVTAGARFPETSPLFGLAALESIDPAAVGAGSPETNAFGSDVSLEPAAGAARPTSFEAGRARFPEEMAVGCGASVELSADAAELEAAAAAAAAAAAVAVTRAKSSVSFAFFAFVSSELSFDSSELTGATESTVGLADLLPPCSNSDTFSIPVLAAAAMLVTSDEPLVLLTLACSAPIADPKEEPTDSAGPDCPEADCPEDGDTDDTSLLALTIDRLGRKF